jgi:hypothetical protein
MGLSRFTAPNPAVADICAQLKLKIRAMLPVTTSGCHEPSSLNMESLAKRIKFACSVVQRQGFTPKLAHISMETCVLGRASGSFVAGCLETGLAAFGLFC